MRIIPKSSKVQTSIWKGLTLVDFILLFAFSVLAFVILISNLPYRWIWALGVVSLAFPLFLKSDGVRAYSEIGHIATYLASQKTFSKKNVAKKAAKKKKSKSKKKGKKDVKNLIPYSEIKENGVIAFNAGYYAKVIEILPVEFALMSEFEQNAKITRLANAINLLSDSQTLDLIKIDRPVNYDGFIAEISAQLEAENEKKKKDKAKVQILETRLAQLQNLNSLEKTYKPYFYFVLYDGNLTALEATTSLLISALENEVELAARTLNAEDTAVFLRYNYNRDFDERDIKNIAREDYVDWLTPDEIKFTWLDYEINGRKASTVAVADYPLTVANGWGARIFDIPNTKVVLHIKTLDQQKAVRRIDRSFVELVTRNDIDRASGQIDNEVHIETMGALLKSLRMDSERLFDCTLTVTGYKNDESESISSVMKKIRQRIMSTGCTSNLLRCRQLDGFISASVTERSNLSNFERGINSESLAAIFPFVQSVMIEEHGYTLGSTTDLPVIVDFWKRGGRYTNSNVTVIGQPGGGKSYLMKFLISLLYGDNSKIFVLDPENEYLKLCKSLGGTFIDVGSSTNGIINPFQIYDVLTETGERAEPRVVYFAHLRFLDAFFKSILNGIHEDTLETINNLVIECYKAKGIDENTPVNGLKSNAFPIFDDLFALVQKRLKTVKTEMMKEHLQRAEAYLAKFASGGRFANLWNGYSSLSSASRFTVFNFQSLFATKNIDVARAQMLLVTKFIAQEIINARELNRNKTDGALLHPVLIFDEGYQFIDEKNPVALDFVYEQFKKIRKYAGMAAFITQNISDFNKAGIADKTTAILKNTQYHFIFPLREGDVNDLVDLYRGAGDLNEVEQYEIANNRRGRAFLISHAKSRICFDVVAPDNLAEMFDEQVGC